MASEKNISGMYNMVPDIGDISEMDGKYLTFWTDSQLFGVPIADVVQIVGVQQITAIPEFPYYAKGVINLRGNIIPIIDVRLRLQRAEKEYDERTCIIVTSINDKSMGFVVDAVNEVSSIDSGSISPPPTIAQEQSSSYLTGIAKTESGVLLLIDTKRLLADDEYENISQAI